MRTLFGQFLELWARYERPLAIGSMVVGFAFDLIIAKRPDSVFDNLLLLFYLFISASCIVLLNVRPARASDEPQPEPLLLLLILQFCFGGLSSNLLVLYGKSGTPAGSLLFLVLLLAMLVGNEFLRTRYQQARFNIAVYYLLLLTYCIIAVPTFILHSVGAKQFLISGVISLAVAAAFLFVLRTATRLYRGALGRSRLIEAGVIIAVIFASFNALYFFNIIPPVPLSLKQIGIYHYVARTPAAYQAQYEPAPWWQFWQDTSSTYHAVSGESAYCFSSVFAPAGLATPIVHQWERYDSKTGQWQKLLKISYPISGGSAEGYKGFSERFDVTPGEWRCDVETMQGQLIGRVQFTIVAASTTSNLVNASL